MLLHKCDKCGENTTQPLQVWLIFERTPEEVTQLMEAKNAPVGSDHVMRKASRVNKHLELCRKCYDKFKKEYAG